MVSDRTFDFSNATANRKYRLCALFGKPPGPQDSYCKMSGFRSFLALLSAIPKQRITFILTNAFSQLIPTGSVGSNCNDHRFKVAGYSAVKPSVEKGCLSEYNIVILNSFHFKLETDDDTMTYNNSRRDQDRF